MKKTKLTRSLLAAVSIVALTAVVYGCSSGPSQSELDQTEMERDQAQMEVAALQQQINDLRAQLGLEPDDELGDSITELQGQVADLQQQIQDAADDAADAEAEKMRMEMAATGKALYAALEDDDTGTTPLTNIGAPTLAAAGLTIDATTGAGALATTAGDPAAVTLEAGDSAGSLGGWMGTNYAHMDSGTKIENAAVVYANQGAAKSVSFAAAGYTVATETTGTARKGAVLVVNTGTVESGFAIADVMANAFTHSGTQTHQKDDRADALYVRGTYDGAPGEYRCETGCSSTNDGMGSPSALGGTWHFTPDAGAMVSQPDANYLYFGWWVSKDKDGAPTAASAFAGLMGDVDGTAGTTTGTSLTGSATYAGHAAGKFALDYSQNKVLDGAGDGGHFTADVMLTAKFGDPNGTPAVADAGITGTINNFMANGESVPWSVALHRATWGASGAITAPADVSGTEDVNEGLGTTWSIDGTSAPASGTWSGQMYDEMPGDAPDGDGSTVPTTVTGTFYSEFDSVGRMVGAFGADKQ